MLESKQTFEDTQTLTQLIPATQTDEIQTCTQREKSTERVTIELPRLAGTPLFKGQVDNFSGEASCLSG